jgi:hypothetical protein
MAHAANHDLAGAMVMAGAHAGCRGASASSNPSAERCPTHAGSKQRGNGQNGQDLKGGTHFFSYKPETSL